MIDVVGKKWAVCVVSLLGRYGAVRFGAIQRCLSGVSPATLTSTLRALERSKLIRRQSTPGPRGAPVAYSLTARGGALYRSIVPFAEWLRTV